MVYFDLATPNKRISYLRKTFDLTQNNFAELLGVSNVTVHNWEVKEKITITVSIYQKLISVGINPMYIISGESLLLPDYTMEMVRKNIDLILLTKRRK